MNDGYSIDELRKKATLAFKKEDYRLVLQLSEKLAAMGDPEALFTCGIIYEGIDGFDSPDPCKAWQYFERLRREYDFDEGYLGCIRIILARNDSEKLGMAKQYCEYVIKLNGSEFAYLLLGDVLVKLDPEANIKKARRAYLSAAIRGAAWGWRRYANVKWRDGNYVISIIIHVIATILFPLYVLILGHRATRSG